MIVRLQQLCGLRILDDLRDLLADEIGGGVVGGLVEREIIIDRHESEAAAIPARLGPAYRYKCRCALLRGQSAGSPDISSGTIAAALPSEQHCGRESRNSR